MKTYELFDKYNKIIMGLIKPKYDGMVPSIKFEVKPDNLQTYVTVADFIPDKKDERWNWSLGAYRMVVNGEIAASWQLYQLPHCCAICVSCKAFVDPKYRGKRIGTTLNSLRQDIARMLGYSLLMCTDITKNEHQRKLLKTQGWEDIYQVYNKRTTNTVVISVINV